jgi:hypothetical protein
LQGGFAWQVVVRSRALCCAHILRETSGCATIPETPFAGCAPFASGVSGGKSSEPPPTHPNGIEPSVQLSAV